MPPTIQRVPIVEQTSAGLFARAGIDTQQDNQTTPRITFPQALDPGSDSLDPLSETLTSESVLTLLQPPTSGHSVSDDESTVIDFFTEDNGQILLPDKVPLANRGPSTLGVPLTRTSSIVSWSSGVSRASTTQTAFSVETVIARDSIRDLKLEELCRVIDEHRSLQHADIVSAEGYKEWTGSVVHRYLVLELQRDGRKTIWLRIDRRRGRDVNILVFMARGATTPANDTAKLSATKHKLIFGGSLETEQIFGAVPTLGDLRHLFRVISDELQQYQLWPANCWFFVSLLLEHLGATGDGVFVHGTLPKPQLAQGIRRSVRQRMRVLYSIPDSEAVAQLFVFSVEYDNSYRHAILQHFDPEKARSINQFRLIGGCILCAQEPFPLRTLVELVLSASDIVARRRVITRFALLLTGSHRDDFIIKHIHPSFSGFLRDPVRSGPFSIDIQTANAEMAIACLRIMTVELQRLPTSSDGDTDSLVRSLISPLLLYACQYLMYHVSQLSTFRNDIIHGIATFFQEQVLRWLEVMYVTQSPFIDALSLLRSKMERASPETGTLINDSLDHFRSIMGCVTCPQDILPLQILVQHLSPQQRSIKWFASLHTKPYGGDSIIQRPHTSFCDFICDPARSGPFSVDIQVGHVLACIYIMTDESHSVATLFNGNLNIDGLVQSLISPQLRHACQNFMHHATQLTTFDHNIIHWITIFFQEQVLGWLGVMYITRSPFIDALSLLRSKMERESPETETLINDSLNRFRTIMSCIFCAQEVLSLDTLVQLVLSDGDPATRRSTRKCFSLLLISTGDGSTINRPHPSFFMFLCDPARSGPFSIDTQFGNAQMTLACLRTMTVELQRLPTSSHRDRNSLLQSLISPLLLYACRYLMYHVSQLSTFRNDIIYRITSFFQEQVLRWLEVMYVTQSPFIVALSLLRSKTSPEAGTLINDSMNRFRTAMGCIICAQEALSLDTLVQLVLSDGDLAAQSSMRRCFSLLLTSAGDGSTINQPHPSFFMFLCDPARSGPFSIDAQFGNAQMALACLRIVTIELQRLPTLFDRDTDSLVQSPISSPLLYACQYFMHHVTQLTTLDNNVIHWITIFFQEQVLRWLEVMYITRSPIDALSLLRSKMRRASPETETLINDSLNRFRTTMSCIFCAQEALSLDTLVQLVLSDSDPATRRRTRKCFSLLLTSTGDGSTINRPHPSFFMFLCDPARSGPFSIDTQFGNAQMTLACLRVMTSELHFNMCHLGTSFKGNLAITDTSALVQPYISPQLFYACRYLMHHIAQLMRFDANILQRISDVFREHFLNWLEVMSVTQGPFLGALQLLRSSQMGKGSSEVAVLVNDAAEFAQTFEKPITRSAAHIYLSALAFAPTHSKVHEHYFHLFPGVVALIKGRFSSWLNPEHREPELTNSVAFSTDGTRIVSCSNDCTVRLWDVETGASVGEPLRGHIASVRSVHFSPDNTQIVSGSNDGTVRIWNAKTGASVEEPLRGHTDCVRCVAFSPDSTQIVSCSDDGTIRLWDVGTGASVGVPLRGHRGAVISVSFSPDGTKVVSSSGDQTLRLWDAKTGTSVGDPFRGHTDCVTSVSFSPDGTQIVSGSDDRTVRLWDVKTGASIGDPLIGHTRSVKSVDFSPDNTHIVSGSDDRTVRLWDAKAGVSVGRPLRGHSDTVISVAFSADGAEIVSSSGDRTLRLWNIGGRRAERSSDGLYNTNFMITSSNQQRFGSLPGTHSQYPTDLFPALSSGFRFTEDGWMLGPKDELFVWVPPAYLTGLEYPNSRVIGAPHITELDFRNFKCGTEWARCRDPLITR